MPRNISFALTTDQIRDRTKTVTRRLGWKGLKPGDILNACVKCQGLKPGEKIERICQIIVTDIRREPLWHIEFAGPSEVLNEGFPQLTGAQFVRMFCDEMGVDRFCKVTRIEFEYMEENED